MPTKKSASRSWNARARCRTTISCASAATPIARSASAGWHARKLTSSRRTLAALLVCSRCSRCARCCGSRGETTRRCINYVSVSASGSRQSGGPTSATPSVEVAVTKVRFCGAEREVEYLAALHVEIDDAEAERASLIGRPGRRRGHRAARRTLCWVLQSDGAAGAQLGRVAAALGFNPSSARDPPGALQWPWQHVTEAFVVGREGDAVRPVEDAGRGRRVCMARSSSVYVWSPSPSDMRLFLRPP